MKYRDFQTQITHLPAFNLNDARKLDPSFHRQQFTDWVNRGYILPFIGGYYVAADAHFDENTLFMLANRIYQPSYISLESALSFYHIIPESVLGVTSISTRRTKHFESRWGRFMYSSIKPVLMFGYLVVEPSMGAKYKIASLEKAVLDYLYWNQSIVSIDDFIELRWNKQELHRLDQNQTFEKYLKLFDNKTLHRRVQILRSYIHA